MLATAGAVAEGGEPLGSDLASGFGDEEMDDLREKDADADDEDEEMMDAAMEVRVRLRVRLGVRVGVWGLGFGVRVYDDEMMDAAMQAAEEESPKPSL